MSGTPLQQTPSSLTINSASAMPAPTWHRLRVNDATITLPRGLEPSSDVEIEVSQVHFGAPDAFDAALAAYQQRLDNQCSREPDTRAVVRAAQGLSQPDDLDTPALSTYQKRTVLEEITGDVAQAFETGMGSEVSGYLQSIAEKRFILSNEEGAQASAVVRLKGRDGCATAASFDVVAAPHSALDLMIVFDSPDPGEGVLGADMRVFAGQGASVSITSLQTLDETWTVFDNSGFVLDSDATVHVEHKVLGGKRAYTGQAVDLRGEASHIETTTRYIGLNDQERDFNYVVRHRGRATTSALDANGVLAGRSRKILRGTIDFIHGCKGAEGTERETVLLADKGVENRTVPVILCDEDDVMGNHGATIGHVRPDQHFYLACRGLSDEGIEHLFAVSALEEAYLTVSDEQAREGIVRFAQSQGLNADEGAFIDEEAGE